MILNEHQLKISQQNLTELCQTFSQLKEKYPKPEDLEFYSLGVREHIEQIETEIKDYFEVQKQKAMSEERRLNWLPYARAVAEGLIQFAGPFGAPGRTLLTLSKELEGAESSKKFEEMRQVIQEIRNLLPEELDKLADRADIEKLQEYLNIVADATADAIIDEIRASHNELAEELQGLRVLLESRLPEGKPVPTETELEAARKSYVDYFVGNHRTVLMRGVRADEPVEVNLENLYVDLRIRPGVREIPDQQPISIKKVLHQHSKIVVLSTPGSGKTTLLKRIVVSFASNTSDGDFMPAEVSMPIYLPLGELSNYIASLPDGKKVAVGPHHILGAINEQATRAAFDLPPRFFHTMFENGKCALLFDGLDEIPEARTREEIVTAIRAFSVRFPKNRYILASRPYAYRDTATLAGDVFVGRLDKFSPEDVDAFVNSWYNSVRGTLMPLEQQNADERRGDLKRVINSNERIKALVANPLLLTNIAIVHYNRVQLPQHRAQLYELCTDLMFGIWDKDRRLDITQQLETELPGVGVGERREFFEEIGWWFHSQGIQDFAAERSEVEHRLIEQLAPRFGDDRIALQHKADLLLQTVLDRSGLFIERQDESIAFAHHTFQEYLAARHLSWRDDYIDIVLHVRFDPWWDEVILLTAGHLDGQHQQIARQRLTEMIYAIANAPSETDMDKAKNLFLAARCLNDLSPVAISAEIRSEIIDKLNQLCADQNLADFHSERALSSPGLSSILSDFAEYQDSVLSYVT